MSEYNARQRHNLSELVLLGGILALAACGADTNSEPKTDEEAAQASVEANAYEFDIEDASRISEPVYLPDGRRVTFIPSAFEYSSPIAETLYCGGPGSRDLFIITEQPAYKGAAGGVTTIENHRACSDGILTQSDEVNLAD